MSEPPCPTDDLSELAQLLGELTELRDRVVDAAAKRLARFAAHYPGGTPPSAQNLAHYLGLRQFDLRGLQGRLAAVGLSSLGRGESHALDNLERIIALLQRVLGQPVQSCGSLRYETGYRLLRQHTDELFGPQPSSRNTRIMVTLAADAADDYGQVRDLVAQGMNCARINCAHDGPEVWQKMIDNLRRAASELGRSCPILMDLGGHKIRTGPIARGPAVKHIKVERDPFGRTVAPGQVYLLPPHAAEATMGRPNHLAIPEEVYAGLAEGDRLLFTDNRGKHRELLVREQVGDEHWLSLCHRGAWLCADTVFEWLRERGGVQMNFGAYRLPPFPGNEEVVRVYRGDSLLLRRDGEPGRAPRYDHRGRLVEPASIGVIPSRILGVLKPGDMVWIDDGKIGTEVAAIGEEGVELRVSHCAANGARLRPDKGLNFPEVNLDLPPLSDKDIEDLDFVSRHADMVGFSFVECLADMEQLMEELARRDASHLPIVAKIETNRAVKNLPEIVLGTLGRHRLGVMIARGDLAIELGTSRTAEIQEEILWLCEAAHVPVIWATQVFETLAKKGLRSRPEITDAAMGVRAECVMLNKGPYIIDAVRGLDNVLQRMEAHQHKKTSRLRALHW